MENFNKTYGTKVGEKCVGTRTDCTVRVGVATAIVHATNVGRLFAGNNTSVYTGSYIIARAGGTRVVRASIFIILDDYARGEEFVYNRWKGPKGT